MKSILVPVADRPECVFALDTAFYLANKLGANVTGSHLRPHREDQASGAGARFSLALETGSLAELPDNVSSLNARNASQLFAAVANKNDFKLARKLRVKDQPQAFWNEMVGSPDRLMSIIGPVADLIVVSRPKKKASGAARAFMLAALLNSGRPVLVLPQKKVKPGSRVCIAWNGSTEAARAVSAAMPILQQAEAVHIVSCGKNDRPGPNLSQLTHYLAMWGVDASSDITRGRQPEKELLEQYASNNSNMLVMGAYSRSHLLQRILGGVTHAMLNEANVNLFALHA